MTPEERAKLISSGVFAITGYGAKSKDIILEVRIAEALGAARLEALEEAAKIAEARAAEGEYGTWQGQEGKIIAAAIREGAKT